MGRGLGIGFLDEPRKIVTVMARSGRPGLATALTAQTPLAREAPLWGSALAAASRSRSAAVGESVQCVGMVEDHRTLTMTFTFCRLLSRVEWSSSFPLCLALSRLR